MRPSESAGTPLLIVDSLNVQFRAPNGRSVHAVRDVSFTVHAGECLVVLGESGSGKSATARALLGLHDAESTDVTAAELSLAGDPLLGRASRLPVIRGRRMSMVFQDALSALNPVQRVGPQIAEMFQAHLRLGRRDANEKAVELMRAVQIPDAERRARSFPHELSGGMRQRVVIAMALALAPELVIADEPTTALDVTVQSQILQLFRDLRAQTGMALLLITHDVGVAAELADRIVVMRAGEVVESGSAHQVLLAPRHPYTIDLIRSVPRVPASHDPDGGDGDG